MGKVQDDVASIDNPQADASTLLAAALQQMDGIISGVGLEGVDRSSPVELAAERLVSALQAYPVLPPPPDSHKANILRLWIQQVCSPMIMFVECVEKFDRPIRLWSVQISGTECSESSKRETSVQRVEWCRASSLRQHAPVSPT
ncbi:SAM domain (Sterile alpha motif) [Nesidiocoris tenuis]|uniref:SAM domain (Sterile alpha motif) n=1 Tax=Nesidiocoris tenuis TaxID=355587 RepID=A0ABN7B3T8_9HEMI|nr:SAM domain (Sterile alpha motif) [Nesidiocoris tenuis]